MLQDENAQKKKKLAEIVRPAMNIGKA